MRIRRINPDETDLLKVFLYEAIFLPEGVDPPNREIIEKPELRIYYEAFGSGKADLCLLAEEDEIIVGAVWSRIMPDYGHVDDHTPSLAISLLKEYRGRGIGTRLLREMLDLLREQGYKKVSLSVQKANFAMKMYEKAGFQTLEEKDEEAIMLCWLNGSLP
jgi:ribosomal protein S18 acetylase RimI-like enzyme